MTKKNFLFFILISVTIFSSCGIEEKFTKEVSVDAPEITFDVRKETAKSQKVNSEENSNLQILHEEIININIADKLGEHGLSVNNIKTFALQQSVINVVTGDYTDRNIDLNLFRDMKLYFDNISEANLVASVLNVDTVNGSISFKIENPNQLDKMKNNSIHVIIAKEIHSKYNVRLKLRMRFNMKVGL